MSIRTIVSTFAATIAHLARDAQSPAPPDIVPGTLTGARELLSAVHRVATASVQDTRTLLDGAIRFAVYALGYQRTATTNSPPRPAQPCAPTAGTPAGKPEVTEVKPEAKPEVKPDANPKAAELALQAIELAPQAIELAPQATALAPQATELAPQVTELAPQATALAPQATAVKPDAASERAPPGNAPTATPPSREADHRAQPATDTIAAPSAPPTTTATQGASKMSELIEAIRAAVAQGATAEQKAIGAQACRTILTALGAEPGKPIVLPGAPKPHPLSGITVDQALDLVIARLTMVANAQDTATAPKTTPTPERQGPPLTPRPERRGPQIPLVGAPQRPARAVQEKRTK